MTNSKKTIIFNMRYISLDLTTVNDVDSIESVTSMAIMFCDTDSEETKFLEFNVLQKEYVVKHEQIEKASSEFLKIVKEETKVLEETQIPRTEAPLIPDTLLLVHL